MRRVMVVGQPGSGKSTFARTLSARTGLPVVHLDRLHWAPGWVKRPDDEAAHLALEAARTEAWIIEGNYAATWEARVARADLLVWLDRPVALRLWRVGLRLLRHLGRTRPDMPEGCPERLAGNVDLVRYVWATRRTGRADLARLAAGAPCRVVRLASDGEVAAFLDERAGDPRAPEPARPRGRALVAPRDRVFGMGRGPDPLPAPKGLRGGPGGSRGSPRLPSRPPPCHPVPCSPCAPPRPSTSPTSTR